MLASVRYDPTGNRGKACVTTDKLSSATLSTMEKASRNVDAPLPEQERKVVVPTGDVAKDEPASRKEAISTVDPGRALPLMQVSLRNLRRLCAARVGALARVPCVACPR